MLTASEVAGHLDKELSTRSIQDHAYNGLQVQNEGEIRKVGFAVDASIETFEKTVSAKCQMLVVHHGLMWSGLPALVGLHYRRIKLLISNNLALYAAHLPLDLHADHGNNRQLARLLGLANIEPFGKYEGTEVGCLGTIDISLAKIKACMSQHGMQTTLLPFGGEQIHKVAIVSGGAADIVMEAIERGADLFITGEPVHHVHHVAKEAGINVLFGGHYETETWGVKALMNFLRNKLGLDGEFLEVPTLI